MTFESKKIEKNHSLGFSDKVELILKPFWKKLQNLTDNNSYPNILKLDSCFWATELKYRFGNKAIFFDFFVCFLFGSINNLNIFHGQPQRLVLKDLCSLVPTVRKIFMFPNIVLGISCLILIDCFVQVNFLKSDINFRPLTLFGTGGTFLSPCPCWIRFCLKRFGGEN